MAQALVPSIALMGIEGLVRELGGDPVAIAELSGLPTAVFVDPDLPITISAAADFFERASESCNCPDFGLRLAQRQDLSVTGALFVLMSLSATVGDALAVMSQHMGLHSSGLVVNARTVPEGKAFEYSTAYSEAEGDRQLMEHGMALIAEFVRSHSPKWQPVYVQFRHALPASVRLHHAIFASNIHFNQERTSICIDHAALATPIYQSSTGTRRMVSRLLRHHKSFATRGVVNRTEGIVRALLPYSTDCSIAAVATFLGMSTRSLQRHLAQASVTFEAIRDLVRADLAKKYLLQSTMSVADIADVLGYSQPSAFARSFRRWYRTTPLRFRRLGGTAAPSTGAAIAA